MPLSAPLQEMAAQARRIVELEALLERNLALGSARVEYAEESLKRAQIRVGEAIDGFSRKLVSGAMADVVDVKNPVRLEREFGELKASAVQPRFFEIADAMLPMAQWVGDFRHEVEPPLKAVRKLTQVAEQFRPVVLIVDDDDFQRKLMARLLEAENYALMFAATGAEALASVRKRRPNLILMDVAMPDMNGVEVTRRLKATEQLAGIPVVMITGHSQKGVVAECLQAGAADFVVKPFDREVLLKKVVKYLGRVGSPKD